jgi:hypothetical protein
VIVLEYGIAIGRVKIMSSNSDSSNRSSVSTHRVAVCLLCGAAIALLDGGATVAIEPAASSDNDLVNYPICVVAKWGGELLRQRTSVNESGKASDDYETEIVVDRVISGELRPGVVNIRVKWPIGWNTDGDGLVSGTSTTRMGEIEDVRDLNLWFLTIDKTDPEFKVPYLDSYRAIQPLYLEQFFNALRKANPTNEVLALSSGSEPRVVLRCLKYLGGGRFPWPLARGEKNKHELPLSTLSISVQCEEQLHKLLLSESEDVRCHAAALLWLISGNSCAWRLRPLLSDESGRARGVAAAILAAQRDKLSINSICKTAKYIEDAFVSCELIDALERWNTVAIAPALIAFLEDDSFAYRDGRDIGIPAWKAHRALRSVTGYWFPYNVKQSQEIWGIINAVDSKEGKASKELHKLLPTSESIVADRARIKDAALEIALTNISGQDVTIAKTPSWIESGSKNSFLKSEFAPPTTSDDFTVVKPGEVLVVSIAQTPGLELEVYLTRGFRLFYRYHGGKFGVKAWLGWVEIE